MIELAPLIYDLAIMLGLAGVVVILFQRIHQPVVLGYLVVGIILGPHTPPYAFVQDISNIKILSELGVIFLMFSLGLEFSFQKLTKVGLSASVTGVIEVLVMIVIGFAAGKILGFSHYDSLFLGAALSISSTTIIIKAIEELKLKTADFASLIFGVLIVEDLLAILLLVALSTIVVTNNFFSFDMVNALIRLILVVGGWFLIGYFLVPPFIRNIAHYINEETLTIVSIALCLLLVCIAASFHYSTALGAFIMGSILAETPLVRRIAHLVKPIRDIFAAVFFISVGMLIDPMVMWQHLPAILFISVVTIVGKIVTTSAGTLLTGATLDTSIKVGFGLAQIGEFSFIIVALGAALNATSNTLYPIIVAVSMVTTFATPYLIRYAQYAGITLENKLPIGIKTKLDNYQTRIQQWRDHLHKKGSYRRILLRVVINGIIVAIIFTLIHYFVFHYFLLFPEKSWLGNTGFLLVALLLSSPFIWGMLFSIQKTSPLEKENLASLAYLIWVLSLLEVTILSVIYFNTWITIIFFFSIVLAFFIFTYSHLEKFYTWFEDHLLKNIQMYKEKDKKGKPKKKTKKLS